MNFVENRIGFHRFLDYCQPFFPASSLPASSRALLEGVELFDVFGRGAAVVRFAQAALGVDGLIAVAADQAIAGTERAEQVVHLAAGFVAFRRGLGRFSSFALAGRLALGVVGRPVQVFQQIGVSFFQVFERRSNCFLANSALPASPVLRPA